MGKYRKKPVVIEAHEWRCNGDHPDDYSGIFEGLEGGEWRTWTGEEAKAFKWEGKVVRRFRSPNTPGQTVCTKCGYNMHDHGYIETLEGGHTVCVGDMIITGVQGERYPCKPDIFAATYEEVKE